MGKAVVGIMIESGLFRGIPKGRTGREHLPYYEKGADLYQLTPCFFRIQDININQGKVMAYIKGTNGYVLKYIQIPSVIHNRVLPKNRNEVKILHRLNQSKISLFNRYTRLNKWRIHSILQKNKSIHPYLPDTKIATVASLKEMMGKYGQLIIKPANGSVGKGIMKLERFQTSWHLVYPTPKGKHGQSWNTVDFKNNLPHYLNRIVKKRKYIIQECIPLSTWHGAPYDLRVSVQRNSSGDWQVTGIVGKVAKKSHFLTNVARGGHTHTLKTLLHSHPTLTLHQAHDRVSKLSLQIARYLSTHIRGLADLGLDIGLTDHGTPYFIECNTRDLRITFRNARMYKEWEATHTTPIAFAHYLLTKQRV